MADSHKPIRVMIVDDHTLVRRGLMDFLESFDDFIPVGEASNGIEAIELCACCYPDVILMDLLMPVMDGIEATQEILKNHPQTRIIALTSFQDEQLVKRALEAGITSYLQKNIGVDELADAVRRAFMGETILSPEATRTLIHIAAAPSRTGQNLTAREREVLKLIATGKSNPEIAHLLAISITTVKTHVSNILSKLDVSSRVEAVTIAMKNKLVD